MKLSADPTDEGLCVAARAPRPVSEPPPTPPQREAASPHGTLPLMTCLHFWAAVCMRGHLGTGRLRALLTLSSPAGSGSAGSWGRGGWGHVLDCPAASPPVCLLSTFTLNLQS